MNGNNSMAAKAEGMPGEAGLISQWESIDWRKAESEVNKLQNRIAKAVKGNNWNKAKKLQYLLANSFYARALAARSASGKDGSLPASNMRAALKLRFRRLKPNGIFNAQKPAKAMPELCLIAYKPFQTNKGLSLKSARKKAFEALSRYGGVSSASSYRITGSFLAKRPLIMDKVASFALGGFAAQRGQWENSARIIRYKGEIAIIAKSCESQAKAFEEAQRSLMALGLKLKPKGEEDGIFGLSYRFRGSKLSQSLSKAQIKALVAKLSKTISHAKAWGQEELIKALNSQIASWAKRIGNAPNKDSRHIGYLLYGLLWRWAKRRHPGMGKWKVLNKYWHAEGAHRWVFSSGGYSLLSIKKAEKL